MATIQSSLLERAALITIKKPPHRKEVQLGGHNHNHR